ncbi:MAG: flagellar motor switch protein FliM [Rhodocyclaceae bacterium]
MTQEFLSQYEVDALLKGVTGEPDEAVEAQADDAGVRSYDLASEERIVSGRMPTLELIHERFARNLRIGLFNFLHRNTETTLAPSRVQTYGEFIRNLALPAALNLVRVKPLRGTGLVIFDPNLVFLVVDNMFGGDGRFHTRVEGRDFTPTESRIIRGLLNVVFAEYEKAWKPVFEIQFEFVRTEINSQFAAIASPTEMVVASSFSIEFGAAAAEMHLCIPYTTIEPVRPLLDRPMPGDASAADHRWVKLLGGRLREAEVELSATLGRGELTLRQILGLKPGDVIPIEIARTVMSEVDGVPLAECRYGVQNGSYALKLERFIAESAAAEAAAKKA